MVSSPINAGATTVSGTSVEAEGTTIRVFLNGNPIPIGTTTVDANGNWTLGAVGPFAATNTLNATAEAPGKSVSVLSNTVTVLAPSTPPVITGTYTEGGTSVTGTSVEASGSVIRLYIDGTFIGTTTVDGAGNWTVTGLSPTDPALYTSGVLSATVQATGENESGLSNLVTVACIPPSTALTTAATPNPICEGEVTQITITGAESGVIYTLRNAGNTANMSASRLGRGANLVLTSFPLSATQTLQVQAMRLPDVSCNALVGAGHAITVYDLPELTLTLNHPASVTMGSSTTIAVQNTQANVEYQLQVGGVDVGTPVTSVLNGSTVNLNTGAIMANTTFTVQATDLSGPLNCQGNVAANAFIEATFLVPIESLRLEAYSNGSSNQLIWWTRNERNVSHFEVRRVSDDTFLGSYTAVGNTEGQQLYRFPDHQPTPQASYQIWAMDQDGQQTRSNVAVVTSNLSPRLYPHTAYSYGFVLPHDLTVRQWDLYSPEGKRVRTATAALVELEPLASGLYILHVTYSDGQQQRYKLLRP